MKQYLDLMRLVREQGVYKQDRTGTGTYSVFGHQMRFNLSAGFPLVTTKTCHLRSIIHELLWFLQGDTNIRYLKENGVSIWDEWVKQGTEEHRTLTTQERISSIPKNAIENAVLGAFFETHSQGAYGETFQLRLKASGDIVARMINAEGRSGLDGLLDEFGVPTTELIAGELGPVYGAQWRSWPNPIVHKEVNKVPDLKECIKLLFFNREFLSLTEIPNAFLKEGVKRFDLEEPDTIVTIQERIEASCDVEQVTTAMVNYLSCRGLWYPTGRERIVHEGIDQIKQVVETLISNPDSRRIIVSAWNPALVDQMALPPCHALFQFYSEPLSVDYRYALYKQKMEQQQLDVNRRATERPEEALPGMYPHVLTVPYGGWKDAAEAHALFDRVEIPARALSCQLYQRSADIFLGVPFNIASYALLTMMIAQVTNHVAGDFIWTGGDCHLYSNHLEQADLQLSREPKAMPVMKLNPEVRSIFDFKYDDFSLEGYEPHPPIRAQVAV